MPCSKLVYTAYDYDFQAVRGVTYLISTTCLHFEFRCTDWRTPHLTLHISNTTYPEFVQDPPCGTY